MAGEAFFFFCIAILLFCNLWERMKNRRRLAGLNSRIRQLEELLLEVCAVLEENREKEEAEGSGTARLEPAGQEPGEPESLGKPEELGEPEKPGEPESIGAPGEFGEPEEIVQYAAPKEPEEPVALVSLPPFAAEERPTAEEEYIYGWTGGEDPAPPEQQAADRRHQVLELFHQGIPVKTIARRIGMGQGEAQLIIDLYARRGK